MSERNVTLKSHTGNGYLLKDYKGSRELYKYLWSLTEKLEDFIETEDELEPEEALETRKLYHKFITHIYVSTCLKSIKNKNYEKLVTIPIPSNLIWGKFKRKVQVTVLKEMRIIDYGGYYHSHKGGKCREFRLNKNVLNKAQDIAHQNTFNAWNALIDNLKHIQQVNLFTGRALQSSKKHQFSIAYNNKVDFETPELIKNSLNSLKPCPFNPHEIIVWYENVNIIYEGFRERFLEMQQEINQRHPKKTFHERLKISKYFELYKKYNKAQGLRNNIRIALETIYNQNPTPINQYTDDNEQLFQYSAAYRPLLSGRVTEIHGGFQTLMTPCKKLLLDGVPNIYNYDLKNSQAVILAKELRICDMLSPWLEEYIDSSDMRETLAKEVGITVACWKQCFYSTIMGADTGEFGAIFDSIRSEVGDYEKALQIHENLLDALQPLLTACENWRDFLLQKPSKRYTYKHNNYHWRNACGLTFKGYAISADDSSEVIDTLTGEIVTNKKYLDKLKRMLAAFFLQGKEAQFIHLLTTLCSENEIPVYKNEHDGIITGKMIPNDLIQEISDEVDLPNFELNIKDICSKDKFEKFIVYLETSIKKLSN